MWFVTICLKHKVLAKGQHWKRGFMRNHLLTNQREFRSDGCWQNTEYPSVNNCGSPPGTLPVKQPALHLWGFLSSLHATQHFSPRFCSLALTSLLSLTLCYISKPILSFHYACAGGQNMLWWTETEADQETTSCWTLGELGALSAAENLPRHRFPLHWTIIQFRPLSSLVFIKTFWERIFQFTLPILMDVTAPYPSSPPLPPLSQAAIYGSNKFPFNICTTKWPE